MFLTEKKELDYSTLLLDNTLSDEQKYKYVCHLFRLGRHQDLFIRYENYKNIIESDYILEHIVGYCLGLNGEYIKAHEFMKKYFKIEERFHKGYFSKRNKYLLKLREHSRYTQINYILDNNI